MNNKTKGSILISVCYGALITASLGIIVASSVLITLQGIKHSQVQLEGILHGNNIIEEFKLKELDDYLDSTTIIKGVTTSNGENIDVEVFVSRVEKFYLIEVTLKYQWGLEHKKLTVEGYKYGGE